MTSTHKDSKSDIAMTPTKVEEAGVASSLSTTNDDEQVATTEEVVDESKYMSGPKLYAINTALIVSIFIVQMESSIISTAVVDITDQLGGYEKSSWLFTAYLLTYCGLQMIWAKLSDIAGRKYVLLTSLAIFTLFSGLCGAAQTMDQLIMFRWCQGIGGCGTYALVQLIFLELVPRRVFPTYMALVVGALAISMVVGPLLGGGITLHGSWRWIFLLNVPVGVVTMVALWFTMPKTLWNEPAAQHTGGLFAPGSIKRLDILGAFLMVGTLVMLATSLQQAARGYAWSSAMVLGMLISCIPLAIAFLTWQWFITTRRSNPEPVFPWRICQDRRRIGMIINTFLAGAVQLVLVAQVPQRFITVNDLSPLDAAVRLLTFGAIIPIGGVIAATFVKKGVPPMRLVLFGAIIEIIGIVLLSRISTTEAIDKSQYGYLFMAGLGSGIIINCLVMLVPYIMEKRDLAVGSAATSQFRILGGLVGIAIVVSVSTPFIRSRLMDIVEPETAYMLLARTEIVKTLTPEVAADVRSLFGKGYNLQVRILIGFAVAKLPATAMMWTNVKADQ